MDKLSLSPRRSCPQKNLKFGHVTSQFYRDGEGITEKCILLTKPVTVLDVPAACLPANGRRISDRRCSPSGGEKRRPEIRLPFAG